jgi:ABC-type glycerol-3-phosphate transport system substrate-binding protein
LKRSAWLAAFATAVVTFAVACGSGAPHVESKTSSVTMPPPRTLGELQSVDDLARAFDAAEGRIRVVVLLSPT